MTHGFIKKKRTIPGTIAQILLVATLIIFAFLTIYPIIWLLINSLKTKQEFLQNRIGLPINPTLLNYPRAWKTGEFTGLFINSIIYTVLSTLGILIFSFAASFAFSKIKMKITNTLKNSFIIGILLTLQAIMVPLFLMAHSSGLYDTRLGVLIPYIGLGLPMGIYLGTEFINSIPDALIESARIEGASYFQIFFKIILPMCLPVSITLSIISVSRLWNEFMLINILTSKQSLKSLPVGIMKFSGALGTDYAKQFAALVIGMAPMLVFYFIVRKRIQEGLAAGAVKG